MLNIRPATKDDAYLLKTLIHEFAEYDQLAAETIITEEDVLRDGFGDHPRFRALIAEWDGQVAGYALFFEFYSSFQGRAGLFLEDIFVRPPLRKRELARSCWPPSQKLRGMKSTSAFAGKFSIGTSPLLSFTNSSARSFWTSGGRCA